MTEEQLRQLYQGDPEIFAAFYDQFSPVIARAVRVIRLKFGRPEIDEGDLIQYVWQRLIESRYQVLRSWDPERGAIQTIIGIYAAHRAFDRLRTPARELPADDEAIQAGLQDRQPPFEQTGAEWIGPAMQEYLAECAEGDRAFFQRFLLGDDATELATRFHLTTVNAYKKISRLRKRLLELKEKFHGA